MSEATGAQPDDSQREWFTYAQAEEYTGYSKITLWRAVKRGDLKAGGIPRAPRFKRSELDAFMRGG